MSSAATYIVLKNLKEANASSETHTMSEVNASVKSIDLAKLELGWNDFLLLTFIILCANIEFRLLEKILDWILKLFKKEKKDSL